MICKTLFFEHAKIETFCMPSHITKLCIAKQNGATFFPVVIARPKTFICEIRSRQHSFQKESVLVPGRFASVAGKTTNKNHPVVPAILARGHCTSGPMT